MGKDEANGFQSIKVLYSTHFLNEVSFYTPINYAWPYPTSCRPLSPPWSFSVRGPKLEATYPEHYKANSTLGFDKRNLHHCPQKIKDQSYKSLVRPMLEYGCTVWDPYKAYQKLWLKQLQRRAACFITRTYMREERCIANAIKQLNWPTLEIEDK